METGFGQEGWQFRESPGWPFGAARTQPEWHVLRARLLAAREAWRSLEAARSARRAIGSGSFDRTAAEHVSAYGLELGGVNRVDLGNGNPGEDIDADAVGVSRTGGRG